MPVDPVSLLLDPDIHCSVHTSLSRLYSSSPRIQCEKHGDQRGSGRKNVEIDTIYAGRLDKTGMDDSFSC